MRAGDLVTRAPGNKIGNRRKLNKIREQLLPVQEELYACKYYSVLCVFQALDAAGKDSTIREVFEGLNPNAIRQAAFKRPSRVELQHDFLWRTTHELPRRGEIGIFNRSHYEEVLSVRVHPEYLNAQFPGGAPETEQLWPARFQAIREHERHLATSNVVVMKFWLHVSPAEQAQRFLDRMNEPDKRWKFSAHDVYESGFRQQYDEAVLDMLNATSRPWAPWFAVPADDKRYMRQQVAAIVLKAMQGLPLAYPQPDVEDDAEMQNIAEHLREKLKP
ncbi:MAG: polyphosphate kinase 2 family protein [Xanthomonadales bacterium]|nr:polyphosphate kinase 2 family protein [Gammaproteobacteria bacterium]NNE06457.1 polyphosphate kinase 2 family protein [Xanthomonadales bacterium]NNL94605.1 polyphosphate kinase 2 family protein [Xanthomonadales bacterium]